MIKIPQKFEILVMPLKHSRKISMQIQHTKCIGKLNWTKGIRNGQKSSLSSKLVIIFKIEICAINNRIFDWMPTSGWEETIPSQGQYAINSLFCFNFSKELFFPWPWEWFARALIVGIFLFLWKYLKISAQAICRYSIATAAIYRFFTYKYQRPMKSNSLFK